MDFNQVKGILLDVGIRLGASEGIDTILPTSYRNGTEYLVLTTLRVMHLKGRGRTNSGYWAELRSIRGAGITYVRRQFSLLLLALLIPLIGLLASVTLYFEYTNDSALSALVLGAAFAVGAVLFLLWWVSGGTSTVRIDLGGNNLEVSIPRKSEERAREFINQLFDLKSHYLEAIC